MRGVVHVWLVGAAGAGLLAPGCLLPELVIGTDVGTGGTDATGGMGGDSGGSGGETSAGGTGGTGAGSGDGGTGGDPGTGGDGPDSGGGGGSGGDGTGGADPVGPDGPCDVYAAAGHECVAAYSTVRRLVSTYTGPLYQVRASSSAYNIGGQRVTNPETAGAYETTPQPGMLHDVPQTEDGFAHAAMQEVYCGGTTCTIATLYDQTGRGNHLTVAKAGPSGGGSVYSGHDNFETIATTGPLSVGGHDVFSLHMEARQGYRLEGVGNGVPLGDAPVALYLLVDGTRVGTACCWDFGIVGPDPKTLAPMTSLFFGTAYWAKGAGLGPWFGGDFASGIWMGGSEPGDPGWGQFSNFGDPNPNNPSLKVPYALGFLKVTNDPARAYALRMADVTATTEVVTAYAGDYPLGIGLNHQGGITLGVAGDNSNASFTTFFEGAIVAGFPENETEQAVLENIQEAGYGE